jgi:hypothetical protein
MCYTYEFISFIAHLPKGEKTAVHSRLAHVVLGKLLFFCFAIRLSLLSSKKAIKSFL